MALVIQDASTPTGYRTVMVSVMSGLGAAVGGSLALVSVGMVSFLSSDASFFSGSEEDGISSGVFYGLAAAGSTVSAGLTIAMIGEEESDYDGILPYPDIRPGDGRPAFLGALAALPVGIASALLIQQVLPADADPFLTYLAVPVMQGVGAAVAINLSR